MPRHPSIRFPSTHWPLVTRAARTPGERSRVAIGELLDRYLRPLRAYLERSRGMSPQDAEDLVQSIIAGRVLEKNLLASADRGRGRFRSFLLAALNRFVADEFRKASRPVHAGTTRVPLEEARIAASDAAPQQAFDVAWAREVVGEVLSRMQAECERSRRPEVWGVFEARVVLPTLEDRPPVPYHRLAERYALAGDEQAANLLVTAKRMFQRMLRDVVRQYAASDADIEAEIQDLKQTLTRGR